MLSILIFFRLFFKNKEGRGVDFTGADDDMSNSTKKGGGFLSRLRAQGAVRTASANKALSAGSSNPTPPPTSLMLEQAGEIIADSYSCHGPPRMRSYFTSPEPLHEPSVEHSPVPIAPPAVPIAAPAVPITPPAIPIVAPALPTVTTTGADEAISDLSDLNPEDQPVKSINMSKKKPRPTSAKGRSGRTSSEGGRTSKHNSKGGRKNSKGKLNE